MYNNSQLKALYIVKYRPYDNVEKTATIAQLPMRKQLVTVGKENLCLTG